MTADRIVWRRSLCQKDALSGITALTEQQKQHVLHFTRETVSESVYLCYCWFQKRLQTKECLSLLKCDLLVWVNSAVIVLLCK